VFVADQARVELNLARQTDLLFDARHDPRHVVLLEREAAPAAGQPGSAAVVSAAAMIDERPTALAVQADVGENGGFLTVLDSFDPDWHVTVDGEPATLLRANVLFRAVRLNPGQHEVRFEYRPTAFFAGGVISLATALSLLVACVAEIRGRGRASLIEVHV
jgi:hypothetical protein